MAADSLNLDEICKKLTGEDLSKAAEIPISSDIDKEISDFLSKKALSTEGDIKDYAKYLAVKHSGNDSSVEKDLIEKIFIRAILLKMKK